MTGPVVALIPARGGSKRLPRKNLRLVGGQPLVARAIAAARDARRIDACYVSTEDDEIAALARSLGAQVLARPPALAGDLAQNDAVARHVLDTLAAEGAMPAVLVLLQPTSPLRTAGHVDECLDAFLGSEALSAMSLCAATHHPGKYVRLENGAVEPYTSDADMEARHQDLAPVFRQNGAIYAVRADAFLRTGRFYLRPCLPYLMTPADSIDVDDEVDLMLADARDRYAAAGPCA
jgi:CMP-N,N'-diacetyllegionaminic acid synthase